MSKILQQILLALAIAPAADQAAGTLSLMWSKVVAYFTGADDEDSYKARVILTSSFRQLLAAAIISKRNGSGNAVALYNAGLITHLDLTYALYCRSIGDEASTTYLPDTLLANVFADDGVYADVHLKRKLRSIAASEGEARKLVDLIA